MTFFMPKRKITLKSNPKVKKSVVKKLDYGCDKCGLDYKNQVRPSIGNNYNGLMIVGDRIDRESWNKHKNFVGRSGEILRSVSIKNRINIGSEAIITNASRCIYGKHKDIYPKCCRKYLHETIIQYKPKLIITLGEIATNSVLNTDTKFRISRLRNHFIPLHDFNCIVFPTFSPYDLLYKDRYDESDNDDIDDEYDLGNNSFKSAKPKEYSFDKDLKRAFDFWKTKGYISLQIKRILRERDILDGHKNIEIKTKKELDKLVKLIYKYGAFSFDYETSNTKPFDDDFQVWLWSFTIKNDEGKYESYAAYLKHFENLNYLRKVTFNLLQDSRLLKIIQNDKFEEICSRWDLAEFWDRETNSIIMNSFCTMLSRHVIDGRKGVTSLDFQNLVKFGIKPYSKEVNKYIKTKKKDDSKTNKIHLCPPDILIKYGNLDTASTYANYEVNKKQLAEVPEFEYCYNLLYEGAKAFADIEEEGFPIDENVLNEIDEFLTEKKQNCLDRIYSSKEIVEFFAKRKKEKTVKTFDTFLRSPKQLQDFLFNFLKLSTIKKTKTGFSTDEEVINILALQGNFFCKNLVDMRKLNKAYDYVKQFRKYLTKDGKLHASINLNSVETFRSSIDSPPLQTIPNHGDIIEGIPYTILRMPFVAN